MKEITFDEFITWATTPGNYLEDRTETSRVVKIVIFDDGTLDALIADGFHDTYYMPWEEFSEYTSVLYDNDLGTFTLENDNGDLLKFTAIGPTYPEF